MSLFNSTPKPERIELIEIKIKKIGQLFNSMDPSPFLEKDLDKDAYQYIMSLSMEHHYKVRQKIIIYIPEKEKKHVSELDVRRAIHNYFEYKKMISEKKVKLQIKEGQYSMIIGVGFLALCLLSNHYISLNYESLWTQILAEGLLISGWVAMWKPISNMLYDWWPMYEEKRIFKKLSEIDIEFRYHKENQ